MSVKYMRILVMIIFLNEVHSDATSCGIYNESLACPVNLGGWFDPNMKSNPLELLIKIKTWWLSAAGSNAADAPPPSRSCVKVTVTDTEKQAECIFNTYLHKPHMTPIVHIVGRDAEDRLEINSIGPIHTYPRQRKLQLNKYMFQNAAIKSTTCWNPETGKFYPYRFIVKNPYHKIRTKGLAHKVQYLYLFGINARMPSPEIHLALLGLHKEDAKAIKKGIDFMEGYNLNESYKFTGGMSYLPRLQVKCASDYP